MAGELSAFSVKINDGPEQQIECPSSLYQLAVVWAVISARVDLPAVVEIWVPKHLPDYPPLHYEVFWNEYVSVQVRHLVNRRAQPEKCHGG